jgi:Tfp pilus assembly protein PilF
MQKLIYKKFRFAARTAREAQALTLIFLLLEFLQLTSAQERAVSFASILEQRVAQYPDSLALRYQLAHGYILASELVKAEEQLRAIIALAPESLVAYNNLEAIWAADSKKKNGNNGTNGGSRKPRDKKKTTTGGVRSEAKPDDKRWAVANDVANQLAQNYAAKGEYAKAESYLRAVMAPDVESFATYNNLGNLCFLQGKLDSAAAYYAKALPLAKTADDSLGIRLNFAAWLHATDDNLQAVKTIAEGLSPRDDLTRIERLLRLKFDDFNIAQASAAQLQGVTAFSMKQLVMSASNLLMMASNPYQEQKEPTPRQTTKAKAAGVRKAPSKHEIQNVFFWAH